MKAAILIPVLTDNDAVGNDARTMQRLLREAGTDARIYCEASHARDCKAYPASAALEFASGPDDLLIYHFSVGWPRALDLLAQARCKRVIKYHNITPPEFFTGIAADYEHACSSGRAEIAKVAALDCELYLGASAYNLAELVAAGIPAERGGVSPPFHRVEALLETEADLRLLDRLLDGRRNFLMVGRVAPNKGHIELVDAFAAYIESYADDGRLLLVGKSDPRLKPYNNAIRQRIAEHRLGDRVVWLDGASEAQLKAAYLASHAMLTLSRHEGFCVPLIEAMALRLPIIAHGSSAIPETLGPAGIVWDSTDPHLYAASAARVLADVAYRTTLQDVGAQRYASAFSGKVLQQRFMQALERIA